MKEAAEPYQARRRIPTNRATLGDNFTDQAVTGNALANTANIEQRDGPIDAIAPAGLYKTDTTTLFSLAYTPFKSKREK